MESDLPPAEIQRSSNEVHYSPWRPSTRIVGAGLYSTKKPIDLASAVTRQHVQSVYLSGLQVEGCLKPCTAVSFLLTGLLGYPPETGEIIESNAQALRSRAQPRLQIV